MCFYRRVLACSGEGHMTLSEAKLWLVARHSIFLIQWALEKVPCSRPFCFLMRDRWLALDGLKSSLQDTNLKITRYSLGLKDAVLPKLRGIKVEPVSSTYFLNRRADSGESISRRKAFWARCWMPLTMVLHLVGGSSKAVFKSSRLLRTLLTLMQRIVRSARDLCWVIVASDRSYGIRTIRVA